MIEALGLESLWLGPGPDLAGMAVELGLPPGVGPEKLAEALLEQLERRYPGSAALVVDQADRAMADPATGAFLARLLSVEVCGVRIFLTTCATLLVVPVRQIALGAIRELGPTELWLTPGEVTERLRKVKVDPEIVRKVAGWPLGLAAVTALWARPELASRLRDLASDELVAPLPIDLRQRAVDLSVWPAVWPEGLAEIDGATGASSSGGWFADIEALRTWGLLQGSGPEVFEWHPLGREVLLEEWKAAHPPEDRDRIDRIAAWLACRDLPAAVDLLVHERPLDRPVSLFHRGQRLLRLRGGFKEIERALERFPAGTAARIPELLLAEAAVLAAKGFSVEADERIQRAHERASEAGASDLVFAALVERYFLMGSADDFEACDALMGPIMALEPFADRYDRVCFYVNRGSLALKSGADAEAQRWLRRALAFPHMGEEANALLLEEAQLRLAGLELGRGRLEESRAHLAGAERLQREFPDNDNLARRIRAFRLNLAIFSGDFSIADAEARRFAVHDVENDATPVLVDELGALGLYHLVSGDLDASEAWYRKMSDVLVRIGGQETASYGILLSQLAAISRRRGELAAADRLHAEAARRIDARRPEHARVLLDWGGTDFVAGNLEECRDKLHCAIGILRRCERPYWLAMALLALGVVTDRLGDGDPDGRAPESATRAGTQAALAEAVAIVELRPYYFLPLRQPEIASALWELLGRYGYGDLLARIESRFPQKVRSMRLADRESPARAQAARAVVFNAAPSHLPPPFVEIRCLGQLTVRVGMRVAPWPRKKAKALAGVLILGAEPFSHEALVDRLCPDTEPRLARRQVANWLFALRRVLEPDLEPWQASRFLKVQDGRYWLDRGELWIDTDEFENAHAEGLRALAQGDERRAASCYERAVALYRGDLLSEPATLEWFDLERERSRMLMIEMLGRLARFELGGDRLDLVRTYADRILDMEPAHEEGHRILMRLLAKLGEPHLVRRQFELCRQLVRQELDSEVSAETERLVAELGAR